MIRLPDLMITTLDTIKAFSLAGVPRFIMDELQNATIANTQETEDITGKQGRLLNRLKRNKGVTVSGTNGMVSAGMMEAQTGGTFENGDNLIVEWSEMVTVASNAATLPFAAAGVAGAEITAVYPVDAQGVATALLEQSTAPAAAVEASEGTQAANEKFSYANKVLTFLDGKYQDGQQMLVYFKREVKGERLANESDVYSEKLRLVIDGTAEDKCGNVYHIQFDIPKADFSGEFELTFGDAQATHAFEAMSLAGSCGAGGALWTYTVFGLEENKAA